MAAETCTDPRPQGVCELWGDPRVWEPIIVIRSAKELMASVRMYDIVVDAEAETFQIGWGCDDDQ